MYTVQCIECNYIFDDFEDEFGLCPECGKQQPASGSWATEELAHIERLISAGKVIGRCSGRSEYGPRALGNRSILADPRSTKMRDYLNTHVKHREMFRPFAPIILEVRTILKNGQRYWKFTVSQKNSVK